MMYLYPLVVEDAGASLPCMFNAIMVWWLNVTWKHKSAAVQVFSTTLSMTPKMTTRSRHALLTPRMVHDCEEEKKRGGGGYAQSPTALQTGPTAVGQREHVALSFTHSFWGTSCGLSVLSVEPSDAAAINMLQRVWVSDSCTVDQGHTVLALSGRASPKKANPLWGH